MLQKEVLGSAESTDNRHELHTKYTKEYETNGFAFDAGVEMEYKLNNALAIRVASVDYNRSWSGNLNGVSYRQGLQFSSGVVLRIGTW